MKRKINLRFYLFTIISIVTFFFAGLILVLNENTKALAFAAEDDAVLGAENYENAIIENEDEETTSETEITTEYAYGEVSTLANNEYFVKGNILWVDNRWIEHPLRRVKVEIYKNNTILQDKLIATTYTDHDGNYLANINCSTLFDNDKYDILF